MFGAHAIYAGFMPKHTFPLTDMVSYLQNNNENLASRFEIKGHWFSKKMHSYGKWGYFYTC